MNRKEAFKENYQKWVACFGSLLEDLNNVPGEEERLDLFLKKVTDLTSSAEEALRALKEVDDTKKDFINPFMNTEKTENNEEPENEEQFEDDKEQDEPVEKTIDDFFGGGCQISESDSKETVVKEKVGNPTYYDDFLEDEEAQAVRDVINRTAKHHSENTEERKAKKGKRIIESLRNILGD